MTVEEKRKRVQTHCITSTCAECELQDGDDCSINISTASESELDNAILKIIGDKVSPNEDIINRPAHYTDGKIEVIDFIEDKKLGFCLGNAIKYISRAGKKDPTKTVEDLKKAIWYINRRIKELEEGA